MRTIVISMAIAAFAGLCVPASASSESVFDAGRLRIPAPRLEFPGDARGIGAGGATPAGTALDAGDTAPGISPKSAAAWSLLLPGLGQQRAGHTLRAKIYYGIEAATWISVASFLWMGYDRENTYKDYAVDFGGVRGTGHSKDFYRTIGEHLSSDGPGGYNEAMRREARDLYYPDVAAMESYYGSHAMTGDESWSWRSESDYRRYGDIRDGSRFAYRVALYSAAAAVALRIVSAADAVRIVRIDRRPAAGEGATSMGLERLPQGFALSVQRSF
jgi:hypothetical protein